MTKMTRVSLESTTLAAAAYDDPLARLELDFRDGTRYVYFGVAPHLYRDLLGAMPTPRDLSLIDIFEAAFHLPRPSMKTKWHRAESPLQA